MFHFKFLFLIFTAVLILFSFVLSIIKRNEYNFEKFLCEIKSIVVRHVPAGRQQWFVARQLTPDVTPPPLYSTHDSLILSLSHALEVCMYAPISTSDTDRLELFLTLSHGRWLCLSIYLSLPTLPPVLNNFMSSFYLLNAHAHDFYSDVSSTAEILTVIFSRIGHYSPHNRSKR